MASTLKWNYQDNVCTGLLGRCTGFPHQGRWWASRTHVPGQTTVSEYPRCLCHCLPGTTSTSTPPLTKTLFGFSDKDFLEFAISPCLWYTNITIHKIVLYMCSYLSFSFNIHTDGFGAMCCTYLWLLKFRKSNTTLEISVRTIQK